MHLWDTALYFPKIHLLEHFQHFKVSRASHVSYHRYFSLYFNKHSTIQLSLKSAFEFIKTQNERWIRLQRTGSKLPGCFCTNCFPIPLLITKVQRMIPQRCHPKQHQGIWHRPPAWMSHPQPWLSGMVGSMTGQGWPSATHGFVVHISL